MARATAHPDQNDGLLARWEEHRQDRSPHDRHAVGTRRLRRDEFRRFHGPRPQSLSDSLGALTYDKSLGGFRTNITENDASTRAPSVCCLVGASIYLFTDRGSRLTGITILARGLNNLRCANVTATGLGSGIGTSATASGSRTSH